MWVFRYFLSITCAYLLNNITMRIENAFDAVRSQICNVCNVFNTCWIDNNKYEVISVPRRVIEVNIPVRMDNGEINIFQWFRSQHNDARGPFKGGIRFHQNVSRDEVKALSIWMSIKTALVNIPLWGAKWWVMVNPKKLSAWELERLSRWYVREIYKYLGPDIDIPAPDVNTTPEIMAWMMDEYSKLVGTYSPGSFTWKPLCAGGSQWRDTATAQGWLYVLEKILEFHNEKISWKKIILQGAGNAGLTIAKLLDSAWAILVWISDSWGAIYNSNGLEIDKISTLKSHKKSVIEYDWVQKLSDPCEVLISKCDILIPAALSTQITSKNADKIQASWILELANGPVTPDADIILKEKWIHVIPDILANAWGVIVSYFEQVQNNTNFYWEDVEINEKLYKKMIESATMVEKERILYDATYRWAAYSIALKRIFDAMHARGEI